MPVFKRTYKKRDRAGDWIRDETGQPKKFETACFYGYLTDADGVFQRVKLFEDLEASETKLADLKRQAQRGASGLIDQFAEHRKRPLVQHLEDFRRSLQADDNSQKHVTLTINRLAKLFDGCGFKLINKMPAQRVRLWLKEQRLECDGQAPLSVQTCNYYIQHVKQFGKWLVDDDRLPLSPFHKLQPIDEKGDQDELEFERQAPRPDGLEALCAAARDGALWGSKKRGYLSGGDRDILYRVACGTGFRSQELASLTPKSLHLDDDTPFVLLARARSKRRRQEEQLLSQDLATRLRAWLASHPEKGPHDRLWPGPWWKKGAVMLRRDLLIARWAWIAAAGDDDETQARIRSDFLKPFNSEGHPLDFHALRHTFITNMARAKIHPAIAQRLARHSDIRLTMKRYTHLEARDLAGSIEELADFTRPAGREADSAALPMRATGTDGAARGTLIASETVAAGRLLPFPAVPSCPSLSAPGVNEDIPQLQCGAGGCGRNIGNSGSLSREAPVGVEPTMADLQSVTVRNSTPPKVNEVKRLRKRDDAAVTAVAQPLPAAAVPQCPSGSVDGALADELARAVLRLKPAGLRAVQALIAALEESP